MATVLFKRQFNDPPYGMLLNHENIVVAINERSQAQALKIQIGWKIADASFKAPGIHLLTFSQKIPKTTDINLKILNFAPNSENPPYPSALDFFISLEIPSKIIDLKRKIGLHFPGNPYPGEISLFAPGHPETPLNDLSHVPESSHAAAAPLLITFVGRFSSSLSRETCHAFCKAFKNAKKIKISRGPAPRPLKTASAQKNCPSPTHFFGLSRDLHSDFRPLVAPARLERRTSPLRPVTSPPPNLTLFPYSALIRLAILMAVLTSETLFSVANVATFILSLCLYTIKSNLLSWCVYRVSPEFYDFWNVKVSDVVKNKMDSLKSRISPNALVNRMARRSGVWGSEVVLFVYGFSASLYPQWNVPDEMLNRGG